MQQAQRQLALQHRLGASDRSFVTQCWRDHRLRVDCRQPLQLREVSVEYPFPGSRNHALVSVGSTVVSASVACELVEPALNSAAKSGLFDITVHAPDATTVSSRGPVAVDIKITLEAIFKTGGALDMESLCVIPGRFVWSVSLTVTLLADAGNAVDAACWAALAALRHSRRPEISISNDRVLLHPVRDREPVPLSLHHQPIAVSAVIMEGGGILLDPTMSEAASGQSIITVAVTPSMQLCGVHKRGGLPCEYPEIQQVAAAAKGIAAGIDSLISTAMQTDETERKAAQRAQFEWATHRLGVQAHV